MIVILPLLWTANVPLSQVTVNAIPSQYIEPTGTKSITANGSYGVTNYASVNVAVPIPTYVEYDGTYENYVAPAVYTVTVINNSNYGYTLYDSDDNEYPDYEGTITCTADSDGVGFLYVSIEEGVSLYIDSNTVNSGDITYDNGTFAVQSNGSITINYEAD